MRRLSLLLWLGLLLTPMTLTATEATEVMNIATRELPPFAMKDDRGHWQGISIEPWHTIVDKLGLEYRCSDKTPQTPAGRVVVIIWMFVGIIVLKVRCTTNPLSRND